MPEFPLISAKKNILWRFIEAPSVLTRSFDALMSMGHFSYGTPMEDSCAERGSISTCSWRQVPEFPLPSSKRNVL